MVEYSIDDFTDKRIAAFWAKVDKRGPDECWPWIGARRTGRCDHPLFSINAKPISATHVALLFDGRPRPAAPNNCALHSCDNPPCVNPAHLRWGTHRDNTDDALERDRFYRAAGVKNPAAKITEEDVRRIMRIGREGPHGHIAATAREFGLTERSVKAIWEGKNWTSITGLTNTRKKPKRMIAHPAS